MKIPLLIPTRDRYTCLIQLLDAVGHCIDFEDVYLVDMASTYPRTVEFLASVSDLGINVLRKDNLGSRGMLRDPDVRKIIGDKPFFLLDPDVVPCHTNRKDWLEHMRRCIDRYKDFDKIGLSLRVDDLPDHYPRKAEVIEWERRFSAKKVNQHLFDAEVGSTFHICRGVQHLDRDANAKAGRNARLTDCWARHRPWYWNPRQMLPDDAYYLEHAPKRRPGVPEPGVTWGI